MYFLHARRVGNKGRHGSEFSNPQGLCALDDGGIAVADSNNSSVQIFDGDGNLELLLGIRGRKPGNLQRPTGSHVYGLMADEYPSRTSSTAEPAYSIVYNRFSTIVE